MMQQVGVSLDIIDCCQSHVLSGSQVCRRYMHDDYAGEKRGWAVLGGTIDKNLESDQ